MFPFILQLVLTGAVLLLLLLFYVIEDIRGRRLFLSGPRGKLDKLVSYTKRFLVSSVSYLFGQVIKFLLHHGIRTLLKKILQFVRFVEVQIELTLKRQKGKLRQLEGDRIRNHLDDIADHKESSALTDEQKDELRSR